MHPVLIVCAKLHTKKVRLGKKPGGAPWARATKNVKKP